jgi:hypothetical protein
MPLHVGLRLKPLMRSLDVAWATVLATARIPLTAFTVYDQAVPQTGLAFLRKENGICGGVGFARTPTYAVLFPSGDLFQQPARRGSCLC